MISARLHMSVKDSGHKPRDFFAEAESYEDEINGSVPSGETEEQTVSVKKGIVDIQRKHAVADCLARRRSGLQTEFRD